MNEDKEDIKAKGNLINNMASAVAHSETSTGSGHINAGGAYYHYHHPTPAPYPGPNESLAGHSPYTYSPTQTDSHTNVSNSYYHHPPYMPEPGSGYAVQAPMPPPPHQYHHHAPQPAMYYGSWPGSTSPPVAPQMHYGPYQTVLPPEPPHPKNRSRMFKPEQYGGLELNVFDVKKENLASALLFVNRNPKATLFDVDGIIPDIATADENASRFIQKRFKHGNLEEKRLGLNAALSSLDDLWNDHYGNFMLQAIFEFGTVDMKKELMDAIYDSQDVVGLCLHMHGCRVIQKAIRCLPQEDVCKLMQEFHDQVLTFIHDPNGNHVIQRCIQVMSSFARTSANSGNSDLASSLSDQIQFIIDDIVSNIELLSSHRYGCRVVQRAIENCVDSQKDVVLGMIIDCHANLVVDQYGNYVVQQVLACGSDDHQDAILKSLTDNGVLFRMSKHKYASNVVEAVLVYGKPHHKEKILEEMLKRVKGGEGNCCAVELSKDPIANYVVNKAIEVSEAEQKEKLFEAISSCKAELSKSPYAKYVLQRIAKSEKQVK